jgi:glucose/arabinose dehydrogenase
MRSPNRRRARRRRARTTTALAAIALIASCSSTPTPPPPAAPAATTGGLQETSLVVPPALAVDRFTTPRQVLIPAGWTMSVWAVVPGARLAVFTPDGALLVSRPEDGQVVRLTPDGSGTATSSVLLEGLEQPHGMAFDGSTLFVAESNRIRAYAYAAGAATGARTVADGLPDAKSPELGGRYAHALKSVVVGQDRALYFSIGSSGNVSVEDRDADPQRATIMRIPPGGGAPEVFARGVRNGTGLAVAPDGSVWTAVNGRDDIPYPFDRGYGESGSSQGEVLDAYVADHPAEPIARLTPGRDLGWPYCNPDPDVEPGIAGTAFDYTAPPYVEDLDTNPRGENFDCATLAPAEQSIGAHSAPLGMAFATDLPPPYGQGALVGIHGSWNRTPPRAPEVSFFAWANGTLGPQQTLVGGFQYPTGDRWGRPVAAVSGPDGAIYITDDDAGAVYRLAPPGR